MRRSHANLFGITQVNPGAMTAPSTLLCDNTSTTGLTIQFGASAPSNQLAIQVIDVDQSTTIFQVPKTGGSQYNKMLIGAGTLFFAPLAGLDGRQSPPCFTLPDGPTNQGIRVWSGTGLPTRTDTVAYSVVGGTTVTDTSCVASDLNKFVKGTNIPAGAYITSVTAGVSFVMSAAPTGTGTSATIYNVGTGQVGDWYFRRDGTTGTNTCIYQCGTAGTPGSWSGIL